LQPPRQRVTARMDWRPGSRSCEHRRLVCRLRSAARSSAHVAEHGHAPHDTVLELAPAQVASAGSSPKIGRNTPRRPSTPVVIVSQPSPPAARSPPPVSRRYDDMICRGQNLSAVVTHCSSVALHTHVGTSRVHRRDDLGSPHRRVISTTARSEQSSCSGLFCFQRTGRRRMGSRCRACGRARRSHITESVTPNRRAVVHKSTATPRGLLPPGFAATTTRSAGDRTPARASQTAPASPWHYPRGHESHSPP
jgi:hypothetical protein